MDRKPKDAMHLLTVREVRNKKRYLEKKLHNSISKKNSRIYDLNPKPTASTHRIRGNGLTEEQILKELMPFISGHGLKGDNHKVAHIITRSLQSYPRLKNLYTNGPLDNCTRLHQSARSRRPQRFFLFDQICFDRNT